VEKSVAHDVVTPNCEYPVEEVFAKHPPDLLSAQGKVGKTAQFRVTAAMKLAAASQFRLCQRNQEETC